MSPDFSLNYWPLHGLISSRIFKFGVIFSSAEHFSFYAGNKNPKFSEESHKTAILSPSKVFIGKSVFLDCPQKFS